MREFRLWIECCRLFPCRRSRELRDFRLWTIWGNAETERLGALARFYVWIPYTVSAEYLVRQHGK